MNVLLLFPIISAAFFGLGYALTERVAPHISMPSYVFLNGIANILLAIIVVFMTNQNFNFNFLSEKSMTVAMVLIAALAPSLGWVFTIYAVQNVSAAYTAFTQICYPLFTLLFLFLLFGEKDHHWSIYAGGACMLVGAFILIYGRQLQDNG